MGAFSNPGMLADQARHLENYRRFERGMHHHFVMATVLRAHELQMFDALASGGTPASVAARCNIEVNAAHAVLRILHGAGYVDFKGGQYELSSFARSFLTQTGTCSLVPMMNLMAEQAASFNGILTGMNSSKVPDMLDISTPDSNYLAYATAVNAYLHRASADFVGKADLPPIKSIIAGSMGVSTVAHLLNRFPEATVTFGCLPHLVKTIPGLCQEYGVEEHRIDGMHDHGGTPSEDRWGNQSYDLVFLTKKMILEPENKLGEQFAQKACDVLNPGGVAVFWETIYPNEAAIRRSSMLEAVLNMGASPASPVRTQDSFTQLLNGMGFVNVRLVECLFGQATFVVAEKP